MFKSILVLESPWDSSTVKSTSVWPFVSEFAKVTGISAHHQVFLDRSSFLHWVEKFNADDVPAPKLLYIAAHGSEGRIAGLKRDINGATISDAIKKAKNIKYIHFGSCLFGSEANLTSLLNSAKHLKWAAGYENSVDWIDSTVFDILLWRRISSRDDDTKGMKSHTLAENLLADMPGLAKSLAFRFHYRYGKRNFTLP